jgi:hypothetical protein
MKRFWSCAALAALCLSANARAEEAAPAPDKLVGDAGRFEVPYRLTVPKHIMVRAKINGKGPFNFILDTGAPALFIATSVGEKIGLKPDRNGWDTLERFEIEGGVVLQKAKARIETPFQLEGMNGMGLAGAELHGMIGYNILAKYRMEIDFTKDKMVWTPIDWEPKAPMGLGNKGGGGAGGLEMVGSIMKMLGGFMGRKATPDYAYRGFLGVELLDTGEEKITVGSILPAGPAGKSGLEKGDRVIKFQGRTVLNVEDVERFAKNVRPGQEVKLTVERNKAVKDITFKAGEGF